MSENLIQIRQNQRRNTIFNLIQGQNQQLSRFDICKITKYSTTTVKGLVDDLIADGLVSEVESMDNRVGRRPSFLAIEEDALYFAGMECSSDAIDFTVINAAQQAVHHQTVRLFDPLTQDILDTMRQILTDFSQKKPVIWKKIPTISFAIPGKIDCINGIGIQYGNIYDWKHIDFKKLFSEFGKKLCFFSNVDSMLNGYRQRHNIPADQSILFIINRNSVGARLYANGTLLSRYGVVSEVAHMRAKDSSRRCSCGRKGCYDTEITVRAINNKLMEARSAHLIDPSLFSPGHFRENIDAFLRLAATGEQVASDILSEVLDYTAELIDTLLSFFKPNVIVFSSFLCENAALIENQLEQRLAPYHADDMPSFYYILPASEMASFGAAISAYDDFFSVTQPEI